MSDKSDDSIIKEVESRLDYLFRENDESESLEFEENNIDSENYPLKKLRGIILSIDWEINDEIMTRFIEETNRLDIEYKDDKIIRMFLKLLILIAKYIKKKKALAHPNAIKVFNSVFLHLDTVISSKGITKREKKKILFEEINNFNKLKEQIAATKSSSVKKIVEGSEEIELEPLEDRPAPEMPTEEITQAFEEEEPEEIELIPLDERPAPEMPTEEISLALEKEEHQEIELMDFEKKIEQKEPIERTEPEVREEERGEISFVSEEKTAASEIPAIEEMNAEIGNKQADAGNLPAHEEFISALEEFKEIIKAEFKELRAELKLWRENK